MRKYRSPIINIIFWAILVSLAAYICYSFISAPKITKAVTFGTEMKWYYQGNIEADFNDSTQFAALVHKQDYVLQTTFEESESNVCLAFQTEFAGAEVYVDSEKVYSTYEHVNTSDKSIFTYDAPTPQIHFVNLKSVSNGTMVRIFVSLYHGEDKNGISNIIYGKSEDIIDYVFKNDFLGIFLCVALFVCSFIMLVYHLAFRKVITLKGLKYSASFAIIFSVYAISNCVAFSALTITGGVEFYTIKCLSYSAMFVPLILFFSENAKYRATDTFLQGMSIAQAGITIIIALLAAFKITDLYYTHIYVQILSFVQSLLILCALIYDISKRSEKKLSDVTMPVIYAVLLLGMSVETFTSIDKSIPIIWTVSCLFFVIAIMTVSMRNIAQTLKLSAEVETIGKIAYTDGLTGVGNTAAFQNKLKHLEVIKINYKSIAIVQFDVNNLKVINDNLGHEMGDLLITDGSGIIKKSFETIGDVYRVGGDEFVAVVCGDNAMAECSKALNNFEDNIEAYNRVESHKFLLQIAYGVEFYSSDTVDRHLTLKEVQKRADAKMYEKKREMKSKVTKEQVLKMV
ncbi:MAG: GGDEF domain-containing protein [Firmicutes bacterium]|nr:GGDEF domain-containing protein [[Eubacterium] siraeum]MCM1487444.1 GGDEF domain-containing protein [Bacillota bacterium]